MTPAALRPQAEADLVERTGYYLAEAGPDVADRFFDALDAGERRAVLDHETGHLRSFDNLKRTMLQFAPDWLSFTTVSKQIENEWAIAAEEAADDHAAGPDGRRALDLASALLQAARSMPVVLGSVSSFCHEGTVARRVSRLLNDPPARSDSALLGSPRIAWLTAAASVALLAWPALRVSYVLGEAAIRLLQ